MPCEVAARGLGQVRPALDAPDGAGEAGQQGGLPAEPGPDLEHVLGAREPERLDHPRDERRLGRHLVVWYRDRLVEVGHADGRVRHEVRARDRSNRREHAIVADPARQDGGDQIVPRPAIATVTASHPALTIGF